MVPLLIFFAAGMLWAQPVPPASLNEVHRVYVDNLGDEDESNHLRAMLITSLQKSNTFIITEDKEHADAILKGSAKGETYKEVRIHSEGKHSSVTASRSDSAFSGGASGSRYQTSASGNSNGGSNESDHTEERKHEASIAVRLVAKNGDVLWSSTQESSGARYRGASVDVADKIGRQLAADWMRARAWKP